MESFEIRHYLGTEIQQEYISCLRQLLNEARSTLIPHPTITRRVESADGNPIVESTSILPDLERLYYQNRSNSERIDSLCK